MVGGSNSEVAVVRKARIVAPRPVEKKKAARDGTDQAQTQGQLKQAKVISKLRKGEHFASDDAMLYSVRRASGDGSHYSQ